MLGLFGVLGLARRSLHTQRQGVEVAGQNLANVNNPAYARQRLRIETSVVIPTGIGPQGTGAHSAAIYQIRDALLDRHIGSETSVTGFLEAQQRALHYAEASLAEQIDRNASGTEGATAASGVAGHHGLSESLTDFFNAFQTLSTNPASPAERQVLAMRGQTLASKFNQVDQRLGNLQSSLDEGLGRDVAKANELLAQIAELNDDIIASEAKMPGVANDLRDTRQQRLEELAKLVKVDLAEDADGAVSVTVDGELLVDRNQVLDTLQSYDAGAGRLLVRTTAGAVALDLKSGAIEGAIQVRDGALASLRGDLDTLAATLITSVNALHAPGFSLTGSTGANLLSGTGAATIAFNSTLSADPSLIQLSAVAGASGDNQVALQLARLGNTPNAALGGRTLHQDYGRLVASLGQSITSVNDRFSDQTAVNTMLLRQRDAVSGVSLDEEMTDLMKFQTAYEASAKLVSAIDEMLQTLVLMKR